MASSGPETRFIASIHRLLSPSFHWEKMANPYRGGTADCWYSGNRTDLWIEWKFVEVPKRDDTIVNLGLSALQVDWLNSRWNEGRNIWVITGSKEGGVVFTDGRWNLPIRAKGFRTQIHNKAMIAKQIIDHVEHHQ